MSPVNPVPTRPPSRPLWGELVTTVVTPITSELADTLVIFYNEALVPELVCAPPGQTDKPNPPWLIGPDRKAVISRSADRIIGCWILKNSGIYYPCVRVDYGVPGVMLVIRALIYKSFEVEGSNLHAMTTNSSITSWTNAGADTPESNRPLNMPIAKFTNGRIEWK